MTILKFETKFLWKETGINYTYGYKIVYQVNFSEKNKQFLLKI